MNKWCSWPAKANSEERFREVFKPQVLKVFTDRRGRNEKIIGDFISNADMGAVNIGALLEGVYRQARGGLGHNDSL